VAADAGFDSSLRLQRSWAGDPYRAAHDYLQIRGRVDHPCCAGDEREMLPVRIWDETRKRFNAVPVL